MKFETDENKGLITQVLFKNNGQYKKEDEGIPILVDNHPVGEIKKVSDEVVEGYIINRYIGLSYSEIKGKRRLSGIMFGHPVFDVERRPNEDNN